MTTCIWILLLFLIFLVGVGLGEHEGKISERLRILKEIKIKILKKDKGSHTIYEELQLIMDIVAEKNTS